MVSSRSVCRGLALFFFALLTCSQAGAEKVRLQLKWHHQFQFAGYYAAQAQGYYRAADLEVEILPAQPGQDPIETVVQGKAQFGVGATDLLLLRERGLPVVVLASIFQHSPMAFLTLKKAGLQTIHDLAGQKVMMERDSAELLAYLRSEGIADDKVTLLPHSYDIQDLLSGKVDAISVYVTDEPFLVSQAGRDYLLYSPRAAGIDFYSDSLFTTEEMIKAKPEVVSKFREASLAGWEYAVQHPEELVQLIHSSYGQQHSLEHLRFEARQMIPLLQASMVEIGHSSPGRWRSIADVYAGLGMSKRDFDIKGFLYDLKPTPPDLRWLYGTLAGVASLLVVVTLVAVRFARLSAALRLKNLVFDASLAANSIADRSGLITEVNDMFLRIHGYPNKDEVVGKPIARFIVTPEAAAIITLLNETGQWEGDYTGRKFDGSHFAAHGLATPVCDDRGRVLGYQAATLDITERQMLEAQNRQLQKTESLGRMAGAIAHHFNNHLQAVMGNLELVLLDLKPSTKAVEILTDAMKSARKAAEVSRLMLTYLGQSLSAREPMDLSLACQQCLPMLRAGFPDLLVLEAELPIPGPLIRTNANLIQQMLANLVTNAWEAMEDTPGVVHLTVKQVSAGAVPAVNRCPLDWRPQDTDYACLEVADAGCGVAMEDREKLFDPFFSRKFPGRGLGLAAVLGIVRAHGGAIVLESPPGRGSVFRVFLPVTEEL